MSDAVDVTRGMEQLLQAWRPQVLAALNGQEVKLARLEGPFVWHKHDEADELFLVIQGELTLELRDRAVHLGPLQLFVVPRGVEHRPVAKGPTYVLLFEPAGTRNTGDIEDAYYTAPAR